MPLDAFKNDKNKFVVSFFEAVFVTICRIIKSEGLNGRKISAESLTALKNDEDFFNASQGSVASATSVSTRLEQAKKILDLV